MSGHDAVGTRARAPRDREPGAALYGALVSASVLVAAGGHVEDYRSIAVATAVTVVVFWLAHVYVAAQTAHFRGDVRHVGHRLRDAASDESGVLLGGLPAVAVYLGCLVLGSSRGAAATVAVWFSVLLLLGVGYLTARRAGIRGLPAVVDGALAALLGIVIVLGKALLH